MVSHMTCTNYVATQNCMNDVGAQDLYKTNLWQHLVQVKKCSFKGAFKAAAKRKLDAEHQTLLCESMDGLALSRNKLADLNLSFKKMRLGDGSYVNEMSGDVSVMSGDVKDGSSDDSSDSSVYNATKGAQSNQVVFDRNVPCVVDDGLKIQQHQDFMPSSDGLLSGGKSEAMTGSTQCTPESKRC